MGNCCCCCRKYNKHVRFNVGGKKFDTTVGTVTRRGKDGTNLLALLISGKRCCCCRKRGVKRLRTNYSSTDTFIDRDGTHFRHILNWLRDGDGVLPELDAASYRALLREAEYYRLPAMVKAIWEILHPTMEYVEANQRFGGEWQTFIHDIQAHAVLKSWLGITAKDLGT